MHTGKKKRKRKPPILAVPEYLYFLDVWTRFDTFIFQITNFISKYFAKKKRKFTDQRKTLFSVLGTSLIY